MQINSNHQLLENYTLGETLGRGTFGKVKLGTHKLTSEKVAIKILEKAKLADDDDKKRVKREIEILQHVQHPYITCIYEVIETENEYYLIMEYVSGGELSDYIIAKKRIREDEACRLFQQIICAIEYLHENGIAHRDLKPENILLDYNRNIKLIDFGLSNTYRPGEMLKTACGSPCYASPEMIAGKLYNGLTSDIWSCGIILYTMLCGALPFEDKNATSLYRKILDEDLLLPNYLSSTAQDLLKQLLNKNPLLRYTIPGIKQDPWYNINDNKALEFSETKIINEAILESLNGYGFDVDEARRSFNENRHNHSNATYYLLIQKQKREIHEKSTVKAKNLRVSSLSTTWTQRSEENSPYSGINKVSGNTLQSNGLETILQEGMEKKQEQGNPKETIKMSSSSVIEESKDETGKKSPKKGFENMSPLLIQECVVAENEKQTTSYKNSIDKKEEKGISALQMKTLLTKSPFLNQLSTLKNNVSPTTSRIINHINTDDLKRPRTERNRTSLLTSPLARALEGKNFKRSDIFSFKAQKRFEDKDTDKGYNSEYRNNSPGSPTDDKHPEKSQDNEKDPTKQSPNEVLQTQESINNYGLNRPNVQKSFLNCPLPSNNHNNKNLYTSIRNNLKINCAPTIIPKQTFASPKNAAKIVEKVALSQSITLQKGIQLEKSHSNPTKQNGTSIEDIKKLIKNSFCQKLFVKEDNYHHQPTHSSHLSHYNHTEVERNNNPVSDYTRAYGEHSSHYDNKSVDQASSRPRQVASTPKSQFPTSATRSKESSKLNVARGLFSEINEMQSVSLKKSMLLTNSSDIQQGTDIRKKSVQRGVTEVSSTLNFKPSTGLQQSNQCEEEQNRLYNKFKKHLVNF